MMSARKDIPAGGKLKVSKAAELAGVSKQTVEYYILLGLLRPQLQPGSRRRGFDESHVQRIKLIKRLNESGYTLREIKDMWLRNK